MRPSWKKRCIIPFVAPFARGSIVAFFKFPLIPRTYRVEHSVSSDDQNLESPQVSAISGSSSILALRGRLLHLAGSYENEGIWVGAYVDDEDLQLAKRGTSSRGRFGEDRSGR